MDRNHAYYHQVQAQIKLTGAEYCDFVAWTKQHIFVERFYCDEDFITDVIHKAEEFFVKCILPELVGLLYSRPLIKTDSVKQINS